MFGFIEDICFNELQFQQFTIFNSPNNCSNSPKYPNYPGSSFKVYCQKICAASNY